MKPKIPVDNKYTWIKLNKTIFIASAVLLCLTICKLIAHLLSWKSILLLLGLILSCSIMQNEVKNNLQKTSNLNPQLFDSIMCPRINFLLWLTITTCLIIASANGREQAYRLYIYIASAFMYIMIDLWNRSDSLIEFKQQIPWIQISKGLGFVFTVFTFLNVNYLQLYLPLYNLTTGISTGIALMAFAKKFFDNLYAK